jgi:hypothetical protein
MANPSVIQGGMIVYGSLSASAIEYPALSVKNSHVSETAGDRLTAAKVVHQFPVSYYQADGAAVAAQTATLHIAKAAGTLVGIQAVITGVVPTTTDTVTIDFQKSTAGGAFATMLTGTIVLDIASVIRVPESGTPIATPTYAAGDVLRIVVTVSGTSGQGLGVTAFVQENPS